MSQGMERTRWGQPPSAVQRGEAPLDLILILGGAALQRCITAGMTSGF